MKIIKYVFLLILMALIALSVFIATQEGKYDITRERVIDVPQPLLFEYINDYRNWENVGILTNNDTTAVFKYSDATSGKGAISTWKQDGTSGEIKTLKVVDNDSIIQKATINDQPSDIIWGFTKVGNGTKVTVRVKGDLTFSDKANAVFKGGVRENLEEKIEKGLASLNNFLVHELREFVIEEKGMVNKTGTYYLCQTVTSKIPDMNRRVTEILPKLMAFIKENRITTNGNPFSIYKTYDKVNNTTTFSVCIPIKDEIFTSPGSEIEGGRMHPYTAFKTTLKGYYSHLPKAWTKAHDAVAERGIPENSSGQYIEVYSRNVNHTKKPSQWVTDIYIPIGPEAVPVTTMEGEEQAATSANITGETAASPKPAATTTRPVNTARPATENASTPKPAGSTTTTPPKPKPKPATITPDANTTPQP